jgi:thiamine biosynthesis protein ThiS
VWLSLASHLSFFSSSYLLFFYLYYETGGIMIDVNGRTVTWHEGMTISDLLAEIKDTHPYPVVRIDDRYVSRPNFDKITVPDNSEVFLIPMIAGG